MNRPEDLLEIRQLSLRGRQAVCHPLGDLSHAFVNGVHWGKERRSHVVLHLDRGMDEGPHPLMSNHVVRAGAYRVADRVNKWLSRDGDTGSLISGHEGPPR